VSVKPLPHLRLFPLLAMAMRSFLRSGRALSRSLLQPDLLRNPNPISLPLVPALQLRSYSPAPHPITQNPGPDTAPGDKNGFKSSLNPVEVAKFAAIAETWLILFLFVFSPSHFVLILFYKQ
jgi:hypothetical protein